MFVNNCIDGLATTKPDIMSDIITKKKNTGTTNTKPTKKKGDKNSIQNKIDKCKQKITKLQKELLELEILRDENTITDIVHPGDYIHIFTDDQDVQKQICKHISEKYIVKNVVKHIYILETNRGGCKYTMYESYTDEKNDIVRKLEHADTKVDIKKKMSYEQNWDICLEHLQKSVKKEQLLKYLVNNFKKSIVFEDIIVYHEYYNNFSYNTLHEIELPILYITNEDESKYVDDDHHTINVITHIKNEDHYEMRYDICRG